MNENVPTPTPFEATALACENMITSFGVLSSMLAAQEGARSNVEVQTMISTMLEASASIFAAMGAAAEA